MHADWVKATLRQRTSLHARRGRLVSSRRVSRTKRRANGGPSKRRETHQKAGHRFQGLFFPGEILKTVRERAAIRPNNHGGNACLRGHNATMLPQIPEPRPAFAPYLTGKNSYIARNFHYFLRRDPLRSGSYR